MAIDWIAKLSFGPVPSTWMLSSVRTTDPFLLLLFVLPMIVWWQKQDNMRRRSATPNDRQRRKREFLARNRQHYGYNNGTAADPIDSWRATELPQLISPIATENKSWSGWQWTWRKAQRPPTDPIVYLDYAGAALPVQSQLQRSIDDSSRVLLLANPHSKGPAASDTQARIAAVTTQVLRHVHATRQRIVTPRQSSRQAPDTATTAHPGYDLVYTSGTTAALRTIAERFDWGTSCDCGGCCTGGRLVYPSTGCHTSVLGMREIALAHGADFCSVNGGVEGLVEWIIRQDDACRCGNDCCSVRYLLVLPLECNLTGTVYDYSRVLQAIARCNRKQRWYTVLDMAKAAATGPVNLRQLDPDFACLSFYKLFGEPTGTSGA